MAYTDFATLRKVLDPKNTGGTAADLEDEHLTEAIQRASNEIDTRLAARYSVPFDPVPDVLGTIAVNLAAYDATLAYYRGVDLSDQDPVVLRYRGSMALLKDLQSAAASLVPDGDGDGEPDTERPQAAGKGINPYEGRMFGLDNFGLDYSPPGRRRW